jgi:hypothetical protein
MTVVVDPPVKPSPWLWTGRQAFDFPQGRESFDKLRTMSFSNGVSNGPGDDDITTLVTFWSDLFIMQIYNEKLYY